MIIGEWQLAMYINHDDDGDQIIMLEIVNLANIWINFTKLFVGIWCFQLN